MLVTAHSNCSFKMISLARAFVWCSVIYIILFARTTNGETYSNKYDHIDVDEILTNSRLRNQYVNCISNLGPCTEPARFLKDLFAEAFVTKCKMCTERQMMFFTKVADWFTKNDLKTWNRVVKLAIEEVKNKHQQQH